MNLSGPICLARIIKLPALNLKNITALHKLLRKTIVGGNRYRESNFIGLTVYRERRLYKRIFRLVKRWDMKFVMAISQTCGKLGKSDRLLCFFRKKSALSENKGDRTLGKGTIAIHPRDYQTALSYWVMGFKSMSLLEVSILNK